MKYIMSVGLLSFIGCRDYEKIIPPQEDNNNNLSDVEESPQNEELEEDISEEENTSTPSDNSENGNGNENPNQTESDEDSGAAINPDVLIYSFANGYQNAQVSEVETASGIIAGEFSAYLYDSNSGDYCSVYWAFDSSSVEEDPNMNSGSVYSYDGEIETWYGFIITSSPQTRGNCSNLPSMTQGILEMLMEDQPSFGYGPLTPNLEYYFNIDHTPNWDEIEDYVFTGIISSNLFSEGGEKTYLDINIAYAYPINNGTSSWNKDEGSPQGGEILKSELPSDAFYASSYFFAIPLH